MFRSFMRGNGLLAVRVHTIGGLNRATSEAGANPFACVAFEVDGERLKFKELMTPGWQDAKDADYMPLNEVAYQLGDLRNHTFSSLFPIYDWESDNGYDNLGEWIETAAQQANR